MIIFGTIEGAEFQKGDYVFIFSEQAEISSIITERQLNSILELSAICFPGKFGYVLHDQVDDFIADSQVQGPNTFLFKDAEGGIGMVAEIEIYEPNARICVFVESTDFARIPELTGRVTSAINSARVPRQLK